MLRMTALAARLLKALYTPCLGEQSEVLKDSMMKMYLGYQNIDEIFKLSKKKMN